MKKSECQAVEAWTFKTLVGAFLDLVIACLLLCASASAYLAAKFLSIFGLSLPCPCNGLFGFPKNTFMQRELVDGPLEKISSVQSSVMNKFPLDLMWVHAKTSGLPQLRKIASARDVTTSHSKLKCEYTCICDAVPGDEETSEDIALDGRDRSIELVCEKLWKDWAKNIGNGEDAINC